MVDGLQSRPIADAICIINFNDTEGYPMQEGMKISEMIHEIDRRNRAKQDFVADSESSIRVVRKPEDGSLCMVLLAPGASELQRFEINENAHHQIAGHLRIPQKHYRRLLADYPDLVMAEINKILETEGGRRLIRTIDGRVRAFLSDRYKPMDNYAILTRALPVIHDDFNIDFLANYVDDDSMSIKAVFTDSRLEHEVARANGTPRIIKPGFRITNSETGRGSLSVQGFFYDRYCKNGCIWGIDEVFELTKIHLGSKLKSGADHVILSESTKAAELDAIGSAVGDCLRAISNPESVAKMAQALRDAASSEPAKSPIGAMQVIADDFGLTEKETERGLMTLLRDGDFSKWGVASAVTEIANYTDLTSMNRANEIEQIGAKILTLDLRKWQKVATAEIEKAA